MDTHEHIEIGEYAARRIVKMLDELGAGATHAAFKRVFGPVLDRDSTRNEKVRPTFLQLRNYALVSYGDIVGLAGDFFPTFADLDSTEWTKADDPEQSQRSEVDKILRSYHKKLVAPDEWNDQDKEDARPGAKWTASVGDTGRVLRLALKNFAHFGFEAVAEWLKYHQRAIDLAIEGFKYYGKAEEYGKLPAVADVGRPAPDPTLSGKWSTRDADFPLVNNLVMALKLNAFGDHFLSDLFSAGHMRLARRRITEQFGDYYPIPGSDGLADAPIDLGSIISGIHHDEDGKAGLWCTPLFGEVKLNGLGIYEKTGSVKDFFAVGDGKFLKDKNSDARTLCHYSVMLSIRDVLIASLTGNDPRNAPGYWDTVGGDRQASHTALRLAPWPYPPNSGWTEEKREDPAGYKWNHYPLAVAGGDTRADDRRHDALKGAIKKGAATQNDDPQPSGSGWFFREQRFNAREVIYNKQFLFNAPTVGTLLEPTGKDRYFDIQKYLDHGEPGWTGTDRFAWRSSEFKRMVWRYVAYKRSP